MEHLLIAFGTGIVAAGMNALVGGGSFFSLPVLIALGIPPVQANASSTVALWPGGAASAWTYHQKFHPICGVALWPLVIVTLIGGLAGSLLLLWTPSSTFSLILPWLLLVATLALSFGRRIGAALRREQHAAAWLVVVVQFVLGVYGGYFGGAVGLIMVAMWCLFGETDIKALNGPRTLMTIVANTIAVLAFIIAGAVRWPETLSMLVGGLIGGWAGARLGRVVPPHVTRFVTLCWTVLITTVFFVRAYW